MKRGAGGGDGEKGLGLGSWRQGSSAAQGEGGWAVGVQKAAVLDAFSRKPSKGPLTG